ncbi:MAG: protein kinase [Ignavibacteriales bacterium]|nr:protein kinase [Ignavibacteriales bacterium]
MIDQTISHYKILEKLGEGGMGVVYKAEDTTLNRLVALKFLPDHVRSSEPDKARFLQEAQAAAALSHPNICTVYGIEEHEGHVFIALEFVEGQTLRDKGLNIPQKQAIDIGIQLAEGLAVAHEKGIVHRDLKPENIMIRKDGRVQIMDFGLAKLKGASRLTKEGSTIGTAGYMSPEQVQGQDTDHRTDIFSLGVVLYELFTGQSPFKGAHETAINYEIVNVDPDPISAIRPDVDPELDRIVFECLQKEPDERYQAVKDISKDLKRFKRESGKSRTSRVSTTRHSFGLLSKGTADISTASYSQGLFDRIPRVVWAGLALLFLATTVVSVFLFPWGADSASSDEVVRAFIPLPEKHSLTNVFGGGHLAVSPDGRKLAFVAEDSAGTRRLWVRPLSELSPSALPGTEGAAFPFWSPDNRYIAFFAGGKLKKVEATGGPPFGICDIVTPRGGSWGKAGIIVFPVDQTVGISQVSEAGGVPKEVTTLDKSRNEQTHRWPYFLPDGRHFLYFSRTTAVGSGGELDAILVASIDGTVNKPLLAGTSNVAYASGHLFYMRENSLMAHPFDPDVLETRGDPQPVAGAVQFNLRYSVASFSVSNTGVLVYQGQSSSEVPEFAWVDLKGKKFLSLKNMEIFVSARLSRDSRKIAMDLYHTGARNSDIWIYEIDRGVNTRFTFDPAVEWYPVWSPDGSRVVFASDRKGHHDLYEKISSGASNEQLLFESASNKIPSDWSPDGKFILFQSAGDPKTKTDIWVLPMSGEKKPTPFLQTEHSELNGRFAPDMRWIAYQSDESGKNEVYVRPFPEANAKWQVSTNGGTLPRWHRNGKEIFCLSSGKIMSVEVDGTGSTFRIGKIREHFDQSSVGGIAVRDISGDGQRILLEISNVQQVSAPLTLVVNWTTQARRK